MKAIPTWIWIVLSCALVTMSCRGDAMKRDAVDRREHLSEARQRAETSAPPEQPKPFDLPKEPIVRGARAGYLPGWGEVTPDGAYTYTMPIEIPPGVGIEPNLAITYSSRAGNGPLGVGFALSGLSSIERCPKTMATHGAVDGVDLDDTDVFCLDGQPLVSIHGAYGADGTEYRTEEDSLTKVVSHGAVESFTAWLKDGRIRTYSPMGWLEWKMTKEVDRSGNAVTYNYDGSSDGDGDDKSLQYITYANARIALTYAPPDTLGATIGRSRPDASISYVAGERRLQTKLLTSITIKDKDGFGRPAWEYKLRYEPSSDTGRERLTEVQRCGGACEIGSATVARLWMATRCSG